MIIPRGSLRSRHGKPSAAVAAACPGIIYVGSLIKIADITDGTSNTYLLGEKYLDPDNYANGNDAGDNEDAMMGFNQDIGACTMPGCLPAKTDPAGAMAFRSAVPTPTASRWPFATDRCICINYSIDATTDDHLANRKDDRPIQGKNW